MKTRMLVIVVLAVVDLASAVAVVQTKHTTRELAHRLQVARLDRDRLNTEWAQLQLEESAWANPDRVAQVARRKLGMVQPKRYTVLEATP